jgi:hypothetical protein
MKQQKKYGVRKKTGGDVLYFVFIVSNKNSRVNADKKNT